MKLRKTPSGCKICKYKLDLRRLFSSKRLFLHFISFKSAGLSGEVGAKVAWKEKMPPCSEDAVKMYIFLLLSNYTITQNF